MDNIYAVLILIVGMTLFLCTIAYYVGFHSGYAKCLKEYEKQPNTDCKAVNSK